jgi:hypothetical protein
MDLAPAIETRLRELPPKRRRVVLDSLNALARELLDRTSATRELKKVQAAGQAAVDAVEVLMGGRRPEVERVSEVLAELRAGTEAEEMDLGELEASGRLQLLALYRAVEEDSLKVAELEEAGISRQRLAQLRQQDRLLGIKLPFQRGFVYPRWQFEDDLTPKGFLPEVLAAAREEGLDPLTVHRVLTRPEAGGGEPPVALCQGGRVDLAVNALRALGQSGG